MSVSHWKRDAAPTVANSCDTVVIGAGITGLAAAYELASLGKRITILERHTIGSGASSRNAGFLMRGLAECYAHAVRDLGHDTARRIWQWSEENLALLKERYDIESLDSYQARPSAIAAMSTSEADELRKSAALLTADGFDCQLQTTGTDTLWKNLKPVVLLVNPRDAAINPWDLVCKMRDTLLTKFGDKVTLIENAEVTGFSDSGDAVLTATTKYPCESVLVCTNAWASELLPQLGANIKPNRGQMLALHADNITLDASYYLNRGSEYIRQAADGSIILGGMRTLCETEEQTASDATTEQLQAALDDYARKVLQTDFKVTARWAGTMGFAPNGLPIIAKAKEHPGNIWLCAGLTGHGMSLGVRTAKAAVEMMLGRTPAPLTVQLKNPHT